MTMTGGSLRLLIALIRQGPDLLRRYSDGAI
jgi:hypothetical protein